MTEIITKLFLLLAGHALADFSLQTDWMAKYKNRNLSEDNPYWFYALSAHALIHGLMVYLVLQNILFAILETVFHWAIDFSKSDDMFNFHVDQILHLICKILWVCLFYLL